MRQLIDMFIETLDVYKAVSLLFSKSSFFFLPVLIFLKKTTQNKPFHAINTKLKQEDPSLETY